MSAGSSNTVTVESDLDSLTRSAAELVIESAASVHGKRFRVALSGGSTPRRLFELLSASPFRDRIDWTRWCVFWADERLVAPDHADSNYRLAEQLLLSRVPVPREHVHRALVELGDGDAVARAYEAQLRAEFEVSDGELLAFDLVLLGMGSDGHTASLFPGKASLRETQRCAVASSPGVLPPPVDRVTLTLPVLNAARVVLFLVAGSDKTLALKSVLSGSSSLPASQVHATGAVRWLVDQTARGD
jgi:6-phosphogluconolactonase